MKSASSFTRGDRFLLIGVTNFSLLRHEICALAFPIRIAAAEVASVTSFLDIWELFSRMAVTGARESRTKVCIQANSLSALLAA